MKKLLLIICGILLAQTAAADLLEPVHPEHKTFEGAEYRLFAIGKESPFIYVKEAECLKCTSKRYEIEESPAITFGGNLSAKTLSEIDARGIADITVNPKTKTLVKLGL